MRRPLINDETFRASVGPVTLDVEHARRLGWSKTAIERTYAALGKLSRQETKRSHRRGAVATCTCLGCDPTGARLLAVFAALERVFEETVAPITTGGPSSSGKGTP